MYTCTYYYHSTIRVIVITNKIANQTLILSIKWVFFTIWKKNHATHKIFALFCFYQNVCQSDWKWKFKKLELLSFFIHYRFIVLHTRILNYICFRRFFKESSIVQRLLNRKLNFLKFWLEKLIWNLITWLLLLGPPFPLFVIQLGRFLLFFFFFFR
jgi:hypothetical protein